MSQSSFLLQASPGGWGGVLLLWVPILLIFWFFMIRPQMRRHKQHQQMISAIARGDTVTTAGGIVGKVTRVQDSEIEVEIAPNVVVKVIKQTVAEVSGKSAADTSAKK